MVRDSQRIGVITGQFIRAQRLCSTLENMKEAVRGVALAAFRKGYKRRELDRQWGKFLVQWWKAEEVRRGELRAWFRKMTSEVSQTVQRENRGIFGKEVQEQGAGQVMCRFRERCWYKDRACPFAHPADRKQASKDSSTNNKEPADGMLVDEDAVQGETSASPNRCPPLPRPRCEERDIEFIPKTQGAIWHARGDGSCLYYSVLKNNDPAAAKALRRDLANYMEQQWNALIPGLTRESTVGDLVNERGPSKDEYLQSVRLGGYGGEIELLLLALMQKGRYRVYLDAGDSWMEYLQYGIEGPVQRLLFRPGTGRMDGHYDLIVPREAWTAERTLIEIELANRNKPARTEEEPRAPVKEVALGNTKNKAREDAGSRQQQMRQQKLQAVRSQAVLDVDVDVDGSVVDAEESQTLELLEMLAGQNRAELTPLSTTQTYPARQRTQTKLYQSEVEEAREKESRKSKGTATQPHIVEEEATEEQRQEEPERPVKQEEPEVETLEETSHNWEEGARIGEAENPGPRSRPVAPSARCRQDGTTLPTKTPGREIIGGRLTTLTLYSSASSQHQPIFSTHRHAWQ
jgi:hypothetical protein